MRNPFKRKTRNSILDFRSYVEESETILRTLFDADPDEPGLSFLHQETNTKFSIGCQMVYTGDFIAGIYVVESSREGKRLLHVVDVFHRPVLTPLTLSALRKGIEWACSEILKTVSTSEGWPPK